MIIIMWARICIVLHNLIIRIKGDNFDEVWRDGLVRRGLERELAGDSGEEDDAGDELKHAQRHLETPGQRFRLKLMDDLFASHFCNAERCPE